MKYRTKRAKRTKTFKTTKKMSITPIIIIILTVTTVDACEMICPLPQCLTIEEHFKDLGWVSNTRKYQKILKINITKEITVQNNLKIKFYNNSKLKSK